MKGKYLWVAALSFLLVAFQVACQSNTGTSPTSSGGNNNSGGGNSGGTTITVSAASSGSSATGYIYTSSSGGSTGTGGLLTIAAHVGNVVIIQGSSFHPLYFDNGTSACIATGATGSVTQTLAAGTYYFHCSAHATSCTNDTGCGSTNCSAMAGIINVN